MITSPKALFHDGVRCQDPHQSRCSWEMCVDGNPSYGCWVGCYDDELQTYDTSREPNDRNTGAVRD